MMLSALLSFVWRKQMKNQTGYFETKRYRCLVYQEKQTDDLYLTICGYEKCAPGYQFNTERRAGYHLHVILGGKGVLYVNGVERPVRHGQMFITKPGEDAWYRADENEPWTYCWMAYEGNLAARYTESAGMPDGVNIVDCNVDQRQFFLLVQRVLDHPELTLSNDLLRLGLLLEYLSLAVESAQKQLPASLRERELSADIYVDYAVTYILSNSSNVKISDVARYIGINRSYLTNIFKKKMVVSPQEYLMQCKLDRACQLLRDTDASIQDISRRVGYDNPLTFSKIFRSRFGMSPTAYRENPDIREQHDEPKENQDL